MKNREKVDVDQARRELSTDTPQRRLLDIRLRVVKKVISPGAFDC